MSKATNLNQLGWKPVQIPDKLDDFEGLLELEELDGVEVKYESAGKLKMPVYELVKPDTDAKKSAEEKTDRKEAKQNSNLKRKQSPESQETNLKKKQGKKSKKNKAERQLKSETGGDDAEEIEFTGFGSEDDSDSTTQKSHSSASGNEFQALEDEDEANAVDVSKWSNIPLSAAILGRLSKLGFSAPTHIQELVLPVAMAGSDVIGKAETGSGKTLAFGIPILEHCLRNINKGIQALIMAPTRELAQQIYNHLEQCNPSTDIHIVTVTGGLAIQKQQRLLAKKPSIVIGTPGRLWSVISSQGFDEEFKNVKMLVLDEADRLLQKNHFEELHNIIDLLGNPKQTNRQTFIFSATFDAHLQENLRKKQLIDGNDKQSMGYLLKQIHFLGRPEFLDANPETSVATKVTEGLVECIPSQKDLYLYYFLLRYPGKTIVFANGVEDVKRVTPLLKELGVKAHSLYAQMEQKKRLQALERFKSEKDAILIATDVAARGIDIPSVKHVIHYHVPHTADMYIHRSGRTARGTEQGLAILMCGPKELNQLKKLLYRLKRNLDELTTFPVDVELLGRFQPRVDLGHKIVDLMRQDGRLGREEAWLKAAAEELGLESSDDSSDEDGGHSKKQVSATQRHQKLRVLRSELREYLNEEIRVGFSSRYLTSGLVNMADKLVKGEQHKTLIGLDTQEAIDVLKRKKKAKPQH